MSRTIRRECLDLLEDLVGEQGVAGWLKHRQPVLDDRTGAWLLNADPERLLRHLQLLASDLDDDEIDPIVLDRPPARRREKDATRVLGLLDEIFGKGVSA